MVTMRHVTSSFVMLGVLFPIVAYGQTSSTHVLDDPRGQYKVLKSVLQQMWSQRYLVRTHHFETDVWDTRPTHTSPGVFALESCAKGDEFIEAYIHNYKSSSRHGDFSEISFVPHDEQGEMLEDLTDLAYEMLDWEYAFKAVSYPKDLWVPAIEEFESQSISYYTNNKKERAVCQRLTKAYKQGGTSAFSSFANCGTIRS